MKLLLLFLLTLGAWGYEQQQLSMHAKVFEKILLLDSNLKQKLSDKNFVTVILFYDEAEELDAARMKRHILNASSNGEFPFPIEVELKRYKDFNGERAVAYYFLDSASPEKLSAIAEFAAREGIISFAYNYNYLAHGVMLSLRMEKKVYPILNPEAIKKSKINFNPILIRIAKKYQP